MHGVYLKNYIYLLRQIPSDHNITAITCLWLFNGTREWYKNYHMYLGNILNLKSWLMLLAAPDTPDKSVCPEHQLHKLVTSTLLLCQDGEGGTDMGQIANVRNYMLHFKTALLCINGNVFTLLICF